MQEAADLLAGQSRLSSSANALRTGGTPIEHFPLGEDRFPGQVVTDRLVEVLQPRLVRGQED